MSEHLKFFEKLGGQIMEGIHRLHGTEPTNLLQFIGMSASMLVFATAFHEHETINKIIAQLEKALGGAGNASVPTNRQQYHDQTTENTDTIRQDSGS